MKLVQIRDYQVGPARPILWILGPCMMESRELLQHTAQEIAKIMQHRPWVFSSSYDKANRLALQSPRGPGIQQGLAWMQEIQAMYDVPILVDVHSPEEARQAGECVDVLQIPAFLCRQTDLIVAAAQTGKALHIKKGQFLAPWDMKHVAEKAVAQGNSNIIFVERGTSFGYNNLVVDIRSLVMMQDLGYPVSMDASHACQLPGGNGATSGGLGQFVPLFAKVAAVAGVQALYIEVHPNPTQALSDRETQLPLDKLAELVEQVERLTASMSTVEVS